MHDQPPEPAGICAPVAGTDLLRTGRLFAELLARDDRRLSSTLDELLVHLR